MEKRKGKEVKEVRVKLTPQHYERYLRLCKMFDLTAPALAKQIVMEYMFRMESMSGAHVADRTTKQLEEFFNALVQESKGSEE